MAKCANCNNKVENGMVRCPGCGADLSRPGAFLQTIGMVVIALSMIPFALSGVVSREGNLLPVIVGVVLVAAGIGMVFSARAKSKNAPLTVIEDGAKEGSSAASPS